MAIKLDKSNLVRNMARKYKLVPFLDKKIAEGEFPWEYKFEGKEHDDAWHPSGDCTPTLRELYLKATGQLERKPISGALYKTFQVGQYWHQYLQWIVEKRLEFCGPEDVERRGIRGWGEQTPAEMDRVFRWYPYHWAHGMGDIAPCTIPGHGQFIVDFKTMKSVDYRLANLPEWCKDKYEAQINIYMSFFDLEQALIVCINKDSPHDFKELTYDRNQPLIDAVYHKWELVSTCLDEGIEPPADEDVPLPLKGPRP